MPTTIRKQHSKRKLSRAARRAISEAQRARWARVYELAEQQANGPILVERPQKFPTDESMYAILRHLQELERMADSTIGSFIDGYVRGYQAGKGIK